MGVRVAECRGSECHPVIGWIEACASPERGQTSTWFRVATKQKYHTQTEKGEQMKVTNHNLRGSEPVDWNSIDWNKVNRNVRQLQVRIAKAEREGRIGKVRSLQRILTRSFGGRALAVKRVTENKGKDTPGVDGALWKTPRHKGVAVEWLARTRYKAQPLRRVYIPKSNGKMRPLGIPTISDRAMQALHLLGLEPVAECRADRVSYGFRKYRSTADAIEQCFKSLCRKSSAEWILEGDIKGCFDHISHDWLLANIPMDKRVLKKWLNAGYLEADAFYSTEEGTPQGGIISPVLANMALDGLELKLCERFKRRESTREGAKWVNRHGSRNRKVLYVRYADDFVITGVSKEFLENEVKPLVREFLAERGLYLSEEKTAITHIEEGFDFLGMTIRKLGGKVLTKPSKKSVERILEKVREMIRRNKAASAYRLIRMLNPVLRGWANHFRHVCSKQIFVDIDNALWEAIWRWAKRRHPKKTRKWVAKKYFRSVGSRNWQFFGKAPDGKLFHLLYVAKTAIRRHVQIRGDANPYDPTWDDYLAQRASGKGTMLPVGCTA
jgi:RNA-directed DNA polymerase